MNNPLAQHLLTELRIRAAKTRPSIEAHNPRPETVVAVITRADPNERERVTLLPDFDEVDRPI